VKKILNRLVKSFVETFKTGIPLIFAGAFMLGMFTLAEAFVALKWFWLFPSLITIGGIMLHVSNTELKK